MLINREGLKPIIKKEINLDNLNNYSQKQIDEVTPLLKETIENYPISTFGLITLMRKYFKNNLVETINECNNNFDCYTSLNYNCFHLSKMIKEELKKYSIDSYLMTYQANKYALNSGDNKVKEAHISILYPTIKDERIYYTIFDPGLKIDQPLSFYQGEHSKTLLVGENKINISYDSQNKEYPYCMNMTGINRYSYNKSDHQIIQKFNPTYETTNIEEMLFPISHHILTGYKAIIYSTNEEKRAYITLSHLEQTLSFSDCITGKEYKYSYDEIEKMGYAKLKQKISQVCYKLQLDVDDIVSNVFFMINYHNDYIKYIMDESLLEEYKTKKNVKRLLR